MAAIDALNGTMFKGRQLAVELSKAQPLVNQMGSGGNSTGAEESWAVFVHFLYIFHHLLMYFPFAFSCRWTFAKTPTVH